MANPIEKGEILANVIIEVVGKPREHVEKSLKLVLDRIAEDDELKILKKDVAKPKSQEAYFSGFADLEMSFTSSGKLLEFCFDYMPASVEITEPESITLDSVDFTHVTNDLLAKLHGINMRVSNNTAENVLLRKNSEALLKNIVMLAIGDEPASLEDISHKVGIKPEDLKSFLDGYVKQGKIKLSKDKYTRTKSLYDNGRQKKG